MTKGKIEKKLETVTRKPLLQEMKEEANKSGINQKNVKLSEFRAQLDQRIFLTKAIIKSHLLNYYDISDLYLLIAYFSELKTKSAKVIERIKEVYECLYRISFYDQFNKLGSGDVDLFLVFSLELQRVLKTINNEDEDDY